MKFGGNFTRGYAKAKGRAYQPWMTTDWWFDRPLVESAVSKAERRVLAQYGRYVQVTDRRSIKKKGEARKAPTLKYGKGGSVTRVSLQRYEEYLDELDNRPGSPPGTPPYTYTNWFPKTITFAYEPQNRGVVAGAEKRTTHAAEALEKGGTFAIRNKRRRLRKVGGSGEVAIRSGVPVYGRIRTEAQAKRANRINAQLYGSAYSHHATYKARPHTQPAFEKTLPQAPRFWQNSVK